MAITEHHLARVAEDTPLPDASDIDYLLMQSVMDFLGASRSEPYYRLQPYMDAVTLYMDMLFRMRRTEQPEAQALGEENDEPNRAASSAVNLGEEGKELACIMFALTKLRHLLHTEGGCHAA